MDSMLKMLGVVLLIWLGLFGVVTGIVTTGVAVVTMALLVGLLGIVAGLWLTFYLLRRDAQFKLHRMLVALLIFGSVVAIAFIVAARNTH